MNKIIFAILFAALFFSTTYAIELKHFNDVVAAIEQGKQLTLVISLAECNTGSEEKEAFLSVKPNVFMIINNSKITTSDTHFTLNEPGYLSKPIYVYAKYDIDKEDWASVKMTFLNAGNFTKITEREIRCKIGQGLTVFGFP